jgi:hypothetical protein
MESKISIRQSPDGSGALTAVDQYGNILATGKDRITLMKSLEEKMKAVSQSGATSMQNYARSINGIADQIKGTCNALVELTTAFRSFDRTELDSWTESIILILGLRSNIVNIQKLCTSVTDVVDDLDEEIIKSGDYLQIMLELQREAKNEN